MVLWYTLIRCLQQAPNNNVHMATHCIYLYTSFKYIVLKVILFTNRCIVQCDIVVLNVCIQNVARVLLTDDMHFSINFSSHYMIIIIKGDSFKIYNNTR